MYVVYSNQARTDTILLLVCSVSSSQNCVSVSEPGAVCVGGNTMTTDGDPRAFIVDPFLKDMAPEDLDPQERLVRVLTARGFLLSEHPALELSDNSCLNGNNQAHRYNSQADDVFLNALLKRNNIGLVKRRRIVIEQEDSINSCVLNAMFLEAQEGQGMSFWKRGPYAQFNFFKERRHGIKLPVYRLDPFIGRLVKAFSAAGILTQSSCDGNGAWEPHVHLMSVFSSVWADVLIGAFHRSMKDYGGLVSCRWTFNSDSNFQMRVHPRKGNLLEAYKDIQRVSRFFHQNRKLLRQIKQDVLEFVQPMVSPKDISSHELRELYMKGLDYYNFKNYIGWYCE